MKPLVKVISAEGNHLRYLIGGHDETLRFSRRSDVNKVWDLLRRIEKLALPVAETPPSAAPGLSLNIADDAFGISALLDDGLKRRELLEGVISRIRRALGEDGRDCLLLQLPELVAAKSQPPSAGWQPIATAPKVHPLNGGDDLLLYWVAPGIGEEIVVVGQWRDGWCSGANQAFPTHWMPLPSAPHTETDK